MDELEQASELIGAIYDAALDPALWQPVLQRIGNFVGGPAAALYSKDTVRKTGNLFFAYGVESKFVQSYFNKYVRFDPFTTSRFFFPVEQVISTQDIMSHDEFFETIFFKEWAKPQGWIDFASASLEKSHVTYAECGIFRHESNGVTDDEARRKMQLIIAHVRRAVAIGKVVDLQKADAAAFANVLDGIAAGLVLVDAAERIVHCNTRGALMLEHESVVSGRGGKLSAVDTEAKQQLRENILRATAGDMAIGSKGIVVPLTARDGDPYVAHILSLTSGARRRTGLAYSAAAAVFVRKAELELPHPVEALAKRYGLTAGETRVLLALVDIGGVPETARMLGISEATVKTHLQRVFGKTGAARQSELVNLVAGYMNPLRGENVSA
jgi:DNA-binding CsgD family transcriptional regulator